MKTFWIRRHVYSFYVKIMNCCWNKTFRNCKIFSIAIYLINFYLKNMYPLSVKNDFSTKRIDHSFNLWAALTWCKATFSCWHCFHFFCSSTENMLDILTITENDSKNDIKQRYFVSFFSSRLITEIVSCKQNTAGRYKNAISSPHQTNEFVKFTRAIIFGNLR